MNGEQCVSNLDKNYLKNMKKLIFICGIIFSAYAFGSSQWVFVTRSTTGNAIFIDMKSVQRSGDSVTLWTRLNYSQRTATGTLSDKGQITINCRTRDNIIRWMITYDDIDNNGKITSNFDPRDSWRPIAPDSLDSAVYEAVCRR